MIQIGSKLCTDYISQIFIDFCSISILCLQFIKETRSLALQFPLDIADGIKHVSLFCYFL